MKKYGWQMEYPVDTSEKCNDYVPLYREQETMLAVPALQARTQIAFLGLTIKISDNSGKAYGSSKL